jgi:acyl carrier protein
MEICKELERFIIEEIMYSDSKVKSIGSEEDLIMDGTLDSLAILKLTGFLEEKMGIKIKEEDLDPDNFCTISCMEKFIQRKQLG